MPIAPLRRSTACALILFLVSPLSGFGWGNEGHRLINKLAASTLPTEVPAFLRTPAAASEIEYLGPEPDRWRSRAEPELSSAQAPEHFIDLEPADALGPAASQPPGLRSSRLCSRRAPGKDRPAAWETLEVWQRLKADLREYRRLAADKAANPNDLHAAEQAAISTQAGSVITSETALSPFTRPSITTDGPSRTIPKVFRVHMAFIGASKDHLLRPTLPKPQQPGI